MPDAPEQRLLEGGFRLDLALELLLDIEPARRDQYIRQAFAASESMQKYLRELAKSLASVDGFLEVVKRPDGQPFTSSDSRFRQGERIGRYMVESLVARGGSGEVYRAQQDTPRRIVALKVLKQEVNDDVWITRLRRESELLALLKHESIARVYDFGVVDRGGQCSFIAMEFVDGLPIDMYCQRNNLDLRRRVGLLASVAEAIAACHEIGVVHRDLKPENILVQDGDVPKIVDFGIAAWLGVARHTLMTNAVQPRGTLPYMSPDCFEAGAAATPERDVYSLGVMLYQLVLGRLPIEVGSDSVERAIWRIMSESPRAERRELRQIGSDLWAVVVKAMEKSPRYRYRNAGELAAELRRWLEHRPVLARTPSVLSILLGLSRRYPAASSLAAVAALSLIAGGVTATSLAIQARRASAELERSLATQRELVRKAIVGVHEAIRSIPEGSQARGTLSRSATDSLEALLATSPKDDPAPMAELADAYLRLAEDQGSPMGHNAGDVEGALYSLRRARDLARGAAELAPSDGGHILLLGLASQRTSRLLRSVGWNREALAVIDECLHWIDGRVEGELRSFALMAKSHVEHEALRALLALGLHGRAHARAQAFCDLVLREESLRRVNDAAITDLYYTAIRCCLMVGMNNEALQWNTKHRAVFVSRVERGERDLETMLNYYDSWRFEAMAWTGLHDHLSAVRCLERALAGFEELQQQRGLASVIDMVARLRMLLAESYAQMCEPDAALRYAQRAVESAEALMSTTSGSRRQQAVIAAVHASFARVAMNVAMCDCHDNSVTQRAIAAAQRSFELYKEHTATLDGWNIAFYYECPTPQEVDALAERMKGLTGVR